MSSLPETDVVKKGKHQSDVIVDEKFNTPLSPQSHLTLKTEEKNVSMLIGDDI